MKKFFFLIFILISSCSSNISNDDLVKEFSFDNEMNIDQFILKLNTYSTNKPYPNIDN